MPVIGLGPEANLPCLGATYTGCVVVNKFKENFAVRIHWLVTAFTLIACVARGQFVRADTKGPRPDARTQVQRWQIGFEIAAEKGPCADMLGTVALPGDWPEQDVKVLDENFSPFVTDVSYRMVGAVKQMVITIPQLPAGQTAEAVITFEITRRALLPPEDPSNYVKPDPKKLPKDLRSYLGPSPRIEIQNRKIKSLAKSITKDMTDKATWEQVEALYDWVRTNIESKEDLSTDGGATQALKDKASNHEGLTSLFIALCRVSDVPARTVWVPKFCYPEFYLEDEDGEGYWFPCQMMGDRSFGGTTELRPIWEKGDNFRTPEKPREAQRYMTHYLTGKFGVNPPTNTNVRRLVETAP